MTEVHIKTEEEECCVKRPRGRPPKISREHGSSLYDNPKKSKHGTYQTSNYSIAIYAFTQMKCFIDYDLHEFCIYFPSNKYIPVCLSQLFECCHTPGHTELSCSSLPAAPRGTHLWEFIRDILVHPEKNQGLMKWEDRREGVFKFLKSEAVAQMWGQKKKNSSMTYEKLSRAMRWVHAAASSEDV